MTRYRRNLEMRHPAEVPPEVELARAGYHRDHPVRQRPTIRRSMGGKRDVSAAAVPGRRRWGQLMRHGVLSREGPSMSNA